MGKTFVVADTHFGHRNIITFAGAEGQRLRDFETIEEMDELMVENWNKVVGPTDRVYHLGDVAINRKALSILNRLNGKMVLVKGNHDIFKLKDYLPYFDDIRAMIVRPKMGITFSHVPIHPGSLGRFSFNVHGHIHDRQVLLEDGTPDERYFCVSVERINYTPIDMEELKVIRDERLGANEELIG